MDWMKIAVWVISFLIIWRVLKIVRTQMRIFRLRSIVEKYPKYADVRCLLGDIYFTEKRFHEAALEYTEALKIYPNYISARMRLAEIYLKFEKVDRAVEQYRSLMNMLCANDEVYNFVQARLEKLTGNKESR